MQHCKFYDQTLSIKPYNDRRHHNDCQEIFDERKSSGKCVFCGTNNAIGGENYTCNGKCPMTYEGYYKT